MSNNTRAPWANTSASDSTDPFEIHEAYVNADTRNPWADTSTDVTTRTVNLDGGTAVVDHVDGRVEVSIRLGDRIVAGLSLSPTEADALGMAMARPHGLTVEDMWEIQDALQGTHATA